MVTKCGTLGKRKTAMRKKYPGRHTYSQWRQLPYKVKHRLVTHAECDLIGLWKTCTKRCRRDRTCRGNPFDCYWKRREQGIPAQFAAEDAKCEPLMAMLNIGMKHRG